MIIESHRFSPHPYGDLDNAFPEGAVPKAAYDQLCRDYESVTDVDVSHIVYECDGLRVTGLRATHKATPRGPVLIYNRGGNGKFGILTVLAVMRQLIPWARAGYSVWASNYRGNDGGEGKEDFGGRDVGDIFELMRIAQAEPEWDGKNTFMVGHSRGGLMTYLAIKQGAKLNAAVSIAAPSDLFASAKERPELETKVYQPLLGDKNREEEYRKRSAMFWPEALIGVPLLLLHGDADISVDVSHTLRLQQALEPLGAEVQTHIYPGGRHALARQWDDVLTRMKDWCERHKEAT